MTCPNCRDRIADLEARNARLAAALEPFATLWASSIDEFPDEQSIHGIASVRMIKRARAALGNQSRSSASPPPSWCPKCEEVSR